MLHIAVCDDNIADRKQSERLLGREAAKWTEFGDTLYADSFGNAEAMLGTPMQFDAFFIDICHTVGLSAMTVVNKLREKNVTVPIVLICSDIDYRTQDFPEDMLYMDKPLTVDGLHKMLIDLRNKKNSLEKLIELRNEEETFYVKDDEIIYAEESGLRSCVTLTGSRHVTVRDNLITLFESISPCHKCFVMPNTTSIINVNHITKIHFRTAHMTDGSKVGVHGDVLKYVNYYREKHPEEIILKQ